MLFKKKEEYASPERPVSSQQSQRGLRSSKLGSQKGETLVTNNTEVQETKNHDDKERSSNKKPATSQGQRMKLSEYADPNRPYSALQYAYLQLQYKQTYITKVKWELTC